MANEVGPVGTDVEGRRILLESLDDGLPDQGSSVTSEWEDSNVVIRLIVQEPMRTTFRVRLPESARTTAQEHEAALRARFTTFPESDDPFWLTSKDSIPVSELNGRLRELDVETFGAMLAAMGFRRYEAFQGEHLLFAADLPVVGRGNVRVAGWTR